MSKKAIMVQADVECETVGPPPSFRAWLENELFAERTWHLPPGQYIEEVWQIRAVPGRYRLRYELIGLGKLTVSNWQVLRGSASVDGQGQLVIHDA